MAKKVVAKYEKDSDKICKKQLTGSEESGKLIWLSQRNDSFEETIWKTFKKVEKLVDNPFWVW